MTSTLFYVVLLVTFAASNELNADFAHSDDAVFEYLDDCDPELDPACREKLESIRDQIAEELFKEVKKNEIRTPRPDTAITNKNDISPNEGRIDDRANNHDGVSKNRSSTSENAHDMNGSRLNTFIRKRLASKDDDDDDTADSDVPTIYFFVIIAACALTGVAGIALSGYCWYKLHSTDDNANKKEYIPGVKKTNSINSTSKNGDSKLDYKAEMYHYVHTKNQIAAMEKAKNDHLVDDDASNGEDDDAEDYTVYECPGLAPTGDMTVVNPLFSDQEVTGSDEGRLPSNRSSSPTQSSDNSLSH